MIDFVVKYKIEL